MDRNPARTASLTDSADCAWQLSQTPDSRACSPAACASSQLYWVICDPPATKTSSLLSRNLTLSKPWAAFSTTYCLQASGPCQSAMKCPSGRSGWLSRSGPADGPGLDLVAEDHLDRHRQQRAGRVGRGEARVEQDARVALRAGELRLHALDVVEEAHVERRVERGVDVA